MSVETRSLVFGAIVELVTTGGTKLKPATKKAIIADYDETYESNPLALSRWTVTTLSCLNRHADVRATKRVRYWMTSQGLI